ncbi:MAG: ATP-binding protein [Candidatus Brocadiaceae bacterium]|jgi:two-component system sensor histidine kinase HydH
MRRVEEVAQQLLSDVAEQRRRLQEIEQRISRAESAIAELEERLQRRTDEGALDLVHSLREQVSELRHDCVSSWAQRLRQWSDSLKALQPELRKVVSLATLGELSASVAHEIRNPLCGMMLSVEVLQTKLDPDDSRMTVLANLHREAEKMEKVVSNLLHFARRYQPRLVCCELEEVVLKSIESVRAHLKRKQIDVRVTRTGMRSEAEIDPDMVQQVFRNILLNSVDASDVGDELAVTVRPLESPAQVAVDFRDRGKGIEGDIVERIFEPFFTSKHDGVGLGLSVSKKIVDAHNGGIEVVSEPGKGTTFTVTFPARAQPESEKVAA